MFNTRVPARSDVVARPILRAFKWVDLDDPTLRSGLPLEWDYWRVLFDIGNGCWSSDRIVTLIRLCLSKWKT